jgi:hypothetical protein
MRCRRDEVILDEVTDRDLATVPFALETGLLFRSAAAAGFEPKAAARAVQQIRG